MCWHGLISSLYMKCLYKVTTTNMIIVCIPLWFHWWPMEMNWGDRSRCWRGKGSWTPAKSFTNSTFHQPHILYIGIFTLWCTKFRSTSEGLGLANALQAWLWSNTSQISWNLYYHSFVNLTVAASRVCPIRTNTPNVHKENRAGVPAQK